MKNDLQSRKWLLTLNNPLDFGFTREEIIERCKMFMPEYFCMADEIATTGTFHTHVFIYSKAPMRFSTLKKRFPEGHIDKAFGSSKENRDYVSKEGKWEYEEKAETKVEGSFYEWGTLPENEDKGTRLEYLVRNISSGMRTVDIIKDNPTFALKMRDVEALRQMITSEQKGYVFRKVETWYLWGKSGSGKTRSIYEQNDIHSIYRITNYRNNQVLFDGYDGEENLVFEEFHSNIPIGDLLNYLDMYPLKLPARYQDRQAMYTRVYITSNIPLDQQYREVQRNMPEVWNAFLRRITKCLEFKGNGVVIENPIDSLRKESEFENVNNPFV